MTSLLEVSIALDVVSNLHLTETDKEQSSTFIFVSEACVLYAMFFKNIPDFLSIHRIEYLIKKEGETPYSHHERSATL